MSRLTTLITGALAVAVISAKADPLLSSVGISPPIPAQIAAGGSTTYTITVARTGSGSMDINLSASGLPTGATASFSPNQVTFSGNAPTSKSAILTITTTAATPDGGYNFTVKAQDGGSQNIVTNTGTLIIGVVQHLVQSPTLTSVNVLADHTASLSGTAASGQVVRIEATVSLAPAVWTSIATNTAGTDGRLLCVDTDAPRFSSRFYRLVSTE